MSVRHWMCENCVYQFNRYPSTNCAVCGSKRVIDDLNNNKEIGNMLITNYLARRSGEAGASCVSTEINDIQGKKDLEESHIQTIILTFGYIREWENQNESKHIPPEITRMIADWGKKIEEKKHIGDLALIMTTKPPIVIDNGTGYTKMGYAGNSVPDYIVPTIIAQPKQKTNARRSDTADLEFYIGEEAMGKRLNYQVENCLAHGIINDWNNIEKYWQRCLFQYMRCDPEEHYVLLTEPPLNPPENREYTAEIMFETFNVPGLYIGVQAVLALIASRLSKNAEKVLTGTVIDAGDGVTHVIPVSDGYVVGSCIKHIPLAGSDITKFILQLLRDRGEPIPPEDVKIVARKVKEQFCYTSPDIVKEYAKYDADASKFKVYEGKHPKTGKPYKIDVGYERFLGPELFFNPEIYGTQNVTPLPQLIDECIQNCPIDTRRMLYRNVVLSGGSTMFKDFARRLQRDIQKFCKKRHEEQQSRLLASSNIQLKQTEVKVIQHKMQRFAVWFGGSMLGSLPQFYEMAHSKQEYEEVGPSVARRNPVFSGI